MPNKVVNFNNNYGYKIYKVSNRERRKRIKLNYKMKKEWYRKNNNLNN